MSTDSLDKRSKDKGHYEKLIADMLKDPNNSLCADCGSKGPRWASFNLGIFLCIRCGGLHRKLGTHVSRVKSITLDSWTKAQYDSMAEWGNVKANTYWLPNPEIVAIPTTDDNDMEQFIRDKYEKKCFRPPLQHSKFMRESQAAQETKYARELHKLQEMGFTNKTLCITALKQFDRDLSQASEWLLKQPNSTSNHQEARRASAAATSSKAGPRRASATVIKNDQSAAGVDLFANAPPLKKPVFQQPAYAINDDLLEEDVNDFSNEAPSRQQQQQQNQHDLFSFAGSAGSAQPQKQQQSDPFFASDNQQAKQQPKQRSNNALNLFDDAPKQQQPKQRSNNALNFFDDAPKQQQSQPAQQQQANSGNQRFGELADVFSTDPATKVAAQKDSILALFGKAPPQQQTAQFAAQQPFVQQQQQFGQQQPQFGQNQQQFGNQNPFGQPQQAAFQQQQAFGQPQQFFQQQQQPQPQQQQFGYAYQPQPQQRPQQQQPQMQTGFGAFPASQQQLGGLQQPRQNPLSFQAPQQQQQQFGQQQQNPFGSFSQPQQQQQQQQPQAQNPQQPFSFF
eukprot:Partr_v1_DN26669_c1_g1_i3_m68951 putative ArfGAP with dual PH domains